MQLKFIIIIIIIFYYMIYIAPISRIESEALALNI